MKDAPGGQQRGRWAEQIALRHLEDHGLLPHSQNYRWRGGEIDLVMLQDHWVVFVEVRYRGGSGYGNSAESVDLRKQRRIVNTARYFLQRHPGLIDRPCRFDVVAVSGSGEEQNVQWIANAFDAG